MNLKIDQEFKNLLPPLSPEELEMLEQSITSIGCKHPVETWNGTIIDGHNRYKICCDNKVQFNTHELNFNNRNEALIYIIDNQQSRRNLSDFVRFELKEKKTEILKEIGKEKQISTLKQNNTALSIIDKTEDIEPHNTQKIIAKELNWSTGKTAQAKIVLEKAPEEVKVKLRNDEITINQAYNEVKQQEQIKKEVVSKPTAVPVFNFTNDNIEWAKWTWNPVTGCLHDCKYCYAKDIADRFTGHFKPEFHQNRLSAPFNTKIPKGKENEPGINNVFVCSMADLFGDWVPDEWINKVLEQVKNAPQWNFLFLTKNPKRYLTIDFPENCWVGATADTNERALIASDVFIEMNNKGIKPSITFISSEPLSERIYISGGLEYGVVDPNATGAIDWVIIGGRSRSKSMPEGQPEWEWVEELVMQSRSIGAMVYFKPNLTVRPKEQP